MISRKRGEMATSLQLNSTITPMLDMSFQLLFFFVVTYNPSVLREGQMDLSLPAKEEKSREPAPQEVKPADVDVETPVELTITIRGQKDPRNRGLLSALTVITKTGAEELRGTREGKTRLEQLADRLETAKKRADSEKTPIVRMEAESEVRWSEVMKVMDVCYEAGFQVSFAKPPDFGVTAR